MKQRSPIAVFFLSIITFGIYALVWAVKTKNEMNKLGAQIPTAWLIIIPFVSIWWVWKYSEGVEKVTNGKMSAVMAFVLQFLLSIIGMAIIQNEFNQVGSAAAGVGASPVTPVGPQPDESFGGPAQTPAASVSPSPQPSEPVSVSPQTNPVPKDSSDPTNPPQQPAA